jgi:GTP-binding protein
MHVVAEFVKSVAKLEQLPKDRLPEIALAGRSNVGKSSLINTLIGKRGLAHTSNTPGRTQALNYYRVKPQGTERGAFYLVDMPGYGFAAVSAARRNEWAQLIDGYLSTRDTLQGIIHVIDMRHPPQPLDLQMSEWLHHAEANFLVVATKADKIAKTKVPEHVLTVAEGLHVDTDNILAFSAETGMGRDEVWRWVLATARGE